ncbi:hypothetical protein TNCV_2987981 [Trichonephila clavipes]|nr:hypothetical protein TNCV_2987981 [Trichonephila clavipes]
MSGYGEALELGCCVFQHPYRCPVDLDTLATSGNPKVNNRFGREIWGPGEGPNHDEWRLSTRSSSKTTCARGSFASEYGVERHSA